MTFNWLLAWWNAIYTLPLAMVLVFLTVSSLVSLVGGSFGDASHEADTDHDVEVDHDIDVDHDVEVDHDHDVETGHEGPGFVMSGLIALGAGRMPLMMLLQMLLLLWGFTGTILHQAVNAQGPGVLAWSMPVSFLVSTLGTRGIAQAFGRFYRKMDTNAVHRSGIVGRTGRVVYPVTANEGTISVVDEHGTLHRVRARTQQGRLESGQEVVIIGFNPDNSLYEVDDPGAFLNR